MSRRVATIAVAVAALVLMVALVLWLRGRSRTAEASTGATETGTATAAATETWEATLWLPSESERLAPLSARIASAAGAEARGRAVLAALLEARPEAPLAALFPAPVRVGRLLLIDGTAYVDLRPEDGGEPPSSGSRQELLRVYSLVQTLVGNVPEVGRVVLLWNGAQRQAFPGHVDTTHALTPLPELLGE